VLKASQGEPNLILRRWHLAGPHRAIPDCKLMLEAAVDRESVQIVTLKLFLEPGPGGPSAVLHENAANRVEQKPLILGWGCKHGRRLVSGCHRRSHRGRPAGTGVWLILRRLSLRCQFGPCLPASGTLKQLTRLTGSL
jgi:hypothetical protein